MSEASFNRITVDGDTSTNDSCVLIATGATGVDVDRNHGAFFAALQELFEQLAQAIIRDAEGATKFVEISIERAASVTDARCMAFTIAGLFAQGETVINDTDCVNTSYPGFARHLLSIQNGRSPR